MMKTEKHWSQAYYQNFWSTWIRGEGGITAKRLTEIARKIRKETGIAIDSRINRAIPPYIAELASDGQLETHIFVSWRTPEETVIEKVAVADLEQRCKEILAGSLPVKHKPKWVLDVSRGLANAEIKENQ